VYLLYVDSSGTPQLGDGNGDLYVLLGLCVHEGTWALLEKSVAALKVRYEFPGVPMELHAKDFCRSFSEQGKIPEFVDLDWASRRQAVLAIREKKLATASRQEARKLRERYRATDPFIHLTRIERSKLFEDALDLVGSQDGVRLFGEAADKRFLFKMTGAKDAVRNSFAQLVSRFDAFLTYSNLGYTSDKGMLMLDQEPTNETLFKRLFAEYRTHGHPWGRVNHVIETPVFVDSASTCGVQAVDLAGYAVRRYIERANIPGTFEEQNFLRIFHKFDRAGPRLHGIRHYCPKNSCRCHVCLARGHADDTPPVADVT